MTHVPDMTAVAVDRPGGPDMLRPIRVPRPVAGPGEVLIAVAAAGVNRPDILQRQGGYPPPKGASPIPGLEVAGTIAAVGEGVARWRPGDRVTALVAGGGYAEYCVAPAGSALPLPDGLGMVEAAALPETFFTVWSNLVDRAGLKAGEVLLVHGGASGIGVAAIQLGRLVGARVFVTAGGAARCARCVALGAERAIDYRSEDFVAVVREATDGQGANVILDMVGGSYVGRNYEVAAVEGRIVQIAFLEGATVTADMTRLMVKRLVHTGSTLRARDPAFKAAIAAQLEARVWPAIAAGTMQPVIDATFPLAEAAAAHARLEAGGHVGKIVLTV
jgi:putative PIG3 family NAD(P)H quinone oxidoreductase